MQGQQERNWRVVCSLKLVKKKFRTNLGINVKPDGDKEEVILNKEAIFDQMKLLGQGLDLNFTSEK